MKIEIKQVDNVLKIVAFPTVAADLSAADKKKVDLFRYFLFSGFVQDNKEIVHWEETPDQKEYHVSLCAGPFALDKALRLLAGIGEQQRLGTSLFKALDSKTVTAEQEANSEILIIYDGKPFKSVEELAEYCSNRPDKGYDLGTFLLSQEELLVSDPCYKLGTWCTGTLKAKTGTWHAQALIGPTDWFTRVKELRIRHESEPASVFDELSSFEDSDIDVGVDSAQCGFFDKARYLNEVSDDVSYEKLCELTCYGVFGGGILEGGPGVVTASGFGDGGYPVRVKKDDTGKVVAAVLRYIFDDNETKEERKKRSRKRTRPRMKTA